jgi:PAS domain S-box-containing protein
MPIQGAQQSLLERIFVGSGEMRQRCRELDWSATPLGAVESWSDCLRSAAQQVLAQPFPSAVYFGEDQTLIYNDGLRALLGGDHPRALGRRACEGLSEGWRIHEPVYARVLAGESLVFEDEPRPLHGAEKTQNAWFTLSYTPLRDGAGSSMGVLVTAYETTARVRSSAALRESKDQEAYLLGLSDALRGISDVADIQNRAERILDERLVADRVRYTDVGQEPEGRSVVENASPAPSDLAGSRALDAYAALGATLPYGIGLVEPDVARSTRFSATEKAALHSCRVGSLAIMPLMRGARLRARMLVTTEKARRWTQHELALISETAERTWEAVERARANLALRESESRQSFLVQLGDALRLFNDPEQINEEASALIARRLEVDAVYSLEMDAQRQSVAVWQVGGAGPRRQALGVFPLAPWAGLVAALRTGEPFVVPDVNASKQVPAQLCELLRRAGVRALVMIPILDGGRLAAASCITQATPRHWGGDEVSLLGEATERSRAAVERARAERERRTSEQKYRTLFDSIDEGVAMLEVRRGEAGEAIGYQLLEQNPALARLLGVSETSAAAVLPGLDPGQLDHVMRTGESARFERASPALGRWVEVYVSRVGGQGSRSIVAVYNDITEHKRSEQALRDSEARQRFLLGLADRLRVSSDAAEIEVVATRLLGEHLVADRAYFATLSERTGTAKVHVDYVSPALASVAGTIRLSDFPQVVNACRAGRTLVIDDIENEPSLSLEERGQFRKLLTIGALVVTPIVQASRFVGALTVGSATARRWTPSEVALVEEVGTRSWAVLDQCRAEAALHASEARFRTFVENARDYAIFLVDTRGSITEWTAGAERLTGYTGAEVLGRSAAVLYTAEDVSREEPLHELREAEALGRAEREAWRVRKDGRRFWVNEIATAVRDEHARLVGFTIISRDLSEQRRSREQREGLLAAATAAHEEAERANLAKDEFLGTLGHELRTPLAAILLWGAALRSGAVAARDMGRAVDAILQSAKTQSRLVDDLLDLSRLSAGKLRLAPAPLDVADIARAACDVVEPAARGKHVALALKLDEGLGRGVFDAARLQQVLWNLLSNAIKFTPSGGQVTLRVCRSSGKLAIDVTDTGEGISPEFMPHVFERFRQADMGRTRQHTGLGIGLALCRHLVELQGGTIEARSEGLGRGAAFSVLLPWSEVAALAVDAGAVPPLGGPERLRGVVVLLVEDDESTREGMAWTLANAGATVVPVSSGAEALARLGQAESETGAPGHLDVIVSDLGLPGMSGYSLIEHAVQLRRTCGLGPLPACAVSAHARDADRQRAIDAGYDLYLAKPVTPEQLIEAVEDLRDVAGPPRPRAGLASDGRAGW